MPSFHFKPKSLLLAILLLSAAVRFYQLESFAGFDFDQELAVTIASNILNGKLTLIGQEISLGGIFVGPLYNYFLAILLFFSRGDPVVLYSSQAVIGIISTLLVYKVAQSFNKASAPIAAILYTFSFRLVYIDKTAAPSNWLVFLTLLSLFVLTRKTIHSKAKLITTSSIAGFATQLHPAGIALLPLALYHLAPKNKLKSISFALISFSLWFTPIFLFDLRHNFLNLSGLLSSAGKAADYPLLFRLFSRANLTLDTWLTTISFSRNLSVLLPVIVLLPQLKKVITNKSNQLLLIALLSSQVIFTFYRGPVLDYYLLPSIVAFILLVSLSLSQLSSLKRTREISSFIPQPKPIVYAWLLLFAATNLSTSLNFKNPNSLKAKQQIVSAIKSTAGNDTVTVHIDSDPGQNTGFNYLFQWQDVQAYLSHHNPDYTIYVPQSRGQEGQVYGGMRLVAN